MHVAGLDDGDDGDGDGFKISVIRSRVSGLLLL